MRADASACALEPGTVHVLEQDRVCADASDCSVETVCAVGQELLEQPLWAEHVLGLFATLKATLLTRTSLARFRQSISPCHLQSKQTKKS